MKCMGVGTVAASFCTRMIWVELGPAALGDVGVDQALEGMDERASPRRCLVLVKEGTDDAGVGMAAGLKG